MPDIQRALDRIAAGRRGDGIEHLGLLKAISEMNPSLDILHEMRRRGIPVVIGADAHKPERVADNYELAMDL